MPMEPELPLSVEAIDGAMLECRRPAVAGAAPKMAAALAIAANPDGFAVRSLLPLCMLEASRSTSGAR